SRGHFCAEFSLRIRAWGEVEGKPAPEWGPRRIGSEHATARRAGGGRPGIGDKVTLGSRETVREGSGATLEDVGAVGEALAATMNATIMGKPDVVETAITVLFAEGHLLIEDVPGVGKTMLAKTLARSIAASERRIQFTPDLLPSDITGVSIYNQEEHRFEFRPGAIFANVVVGDEINRASPKAQSALLECMEEQQVMVD